MKSFLQEIKFSMFFKKYLHFFIKFNTYLRSYTEKTNLKVLEEQGVQFLCDFVIQVGGYPTMGGGGYDRFKIVFNSFDSTVGFKS